MNQAPQAQEQWAKETIDALILAMQLLEEDKKAPLNEEHKEELYKYAPILAAYNRKIDDESKVSEMAKYAFKKRLEDSKTEGIQSGGGELNFFLAYLEAHVCIDVLDDDSIQGIMETVVKKLAA